MIDSRFSMIRQEARQLSRQQQFEGLPPAWSDPVLGPHGRYAIRRASTPQRSTPQQLAAPAVAAKPAVTTPTVSPQQLTELRKAWRQAKREEMELSTKAASPQPAATPVAKSGFASRIRFNGSFNAFKKKAAPAA